MADVFISYSSEDYEIANEINLKLEESGIECWFAPKSLRAGQHWDEKIVEAIYSCKILICLLSASANKSDFVNREVGLAAQVRRTIMPVRIEDVEPERTLPLYFVNTHWYNFFQEPRDYTGLIGSINEELEVSQIFGEQNGLRRSNQYRRINITDRNASSLYRLEDDEIEAARHSFHPLNDFTNMLDRLAKQRVIVVVGDRGSGRYTMAINLLYNLSVNSIYRIYPDIDMKDPVALFSQNQTGYIVEDDAIIEETNNNSWSQLKEKTYRDLSHKLQTLDSYLVITCEGNESLSDLDDYVHLYSPSNSEKYEIFEAQLKQMFSLEEFDWFEKNLLSDRFTEYVGEYVQMNEIISFIHEIRRCINGKVDSEDIFKFFNKRFESDIRIWFQKEHDLDDIAFVISLAVFNNLEYETVFEQAQALIGFIKKQNNEIEFSYSMKFDRTPEDLLQQLNAKTFNDYRHTEFGRVPVKCVGFKKESMADSVLVYIWRSFYQLHEAMLAWFETLGDADSSRIVKAVTKAVANICNVDFLLMKERLVHKWANHSSLTKRLNAVFVLDAMAQKRYMISTCIKLVHSWASSNNMRLCWTAAWCNATDLGAVSPLAVLEDLKVIIVNADMTTIQPVSMILRDLFEYGNIDDAYYKVVLKWLVECTELEDYGANLVALIIFLQLSSLSALGDNKEPEYPLMVGLLQKKEYRQKYIRPIVVNGIRLNYVSKDLVIAVIDDWLDIANEYSNAFGGVARLMLEIIADSQSFERIAIVNLLKKKKKTNASAGKILSLLEG